MVIAAPVYISRAVWNCHKAPIFKRIGRILRVENSSCRSKLVDSFIHFKGTGRLVDRIHTLPTGTAAVEKNHQIVDRAALCEK